MGSRCSRVIFEQSKMSFVSNRHANESGLGCAGKGIATTIIASSSSRYPPIGPRTDTCARSNTPTKPILQEFPSAPDSIPCQRRQKRCRHFRAPYTPVPRSYTMYVHHPAQHSDDSYHVVALKSTTLGNLKLDSSHSTPNTFNGNIIKETSKRLSMLEAEVWSKIIEDNKIPNMVPKTPITTPPGEPETINTWELMAGLEDLNPRPPTHFRTFSYDPKPLLIQFEEEDDDQKSDSVITDFDPGIISSFRRTLEQLPSNNPFRIKPQIYKGHCKLYKDKVVLYFTSLRGVRKTYEDCCDVSMILKSLGLRIDERDVSMHSGFKDELKELMGGEGFNEGGGLLPKVFIGKKYIGGAEEIRKMHKEGSLEKAIEGCQMVDDDDSGPCEACGDIRFVPCEACCGSCKVYYEDINKEDEENEVVEEDNEGEEEEGEYGFQRCPNCNENGLIRCPTATNPSQEYVTS